MVTKNNPNFSDSKKFEKSAILTSEDILFNKIVSEGIRRIYSKKQIISLFFICPIYLWFNLTIIFLQVYKIKNKLLSKFF